MCNYWHASMQLHVTTGSNRSLRSLGPAKAGPLTKRYAEGTDGAIV